MHTAVFLVSNIHCPSCVSYIQDVLHSVVGIVTPVEVSLIEHTVRARYNETLTDTRAISEALHNAAFDVRHVTDFDADHIQIHSSAIDTSLATPKPPLWNGLWSRNKQRHIDNCLACQREKARKTARQKPWAIGKPATRSMSQRSLHPSSDSPGASTTETTVGADAPAIVEVDGACPDNSDQEQLVARILIEGMTCSACTGAITKELRTLNGIVSVDVSLVTNSAQVVYQGSEDDASKMVSAIEDMGYGATVDHVKNQHSARQDLYKAKLAIKGMTCGSCVGTITRGLQELPQVTTANIDLISNSGLLEFSGKQTIDTILEKIDDMGYDADVVVVTSLRAAATPSAERTVQIRVDGMYCGHCPDKITTALNNLQNIKTETPTFQITQDLTIEDPILTITYKPSKQTNITVRQFVRSIGAADEALTASVYQAPTLEMRSRRLQRKERNLILLRLLFTAAVAIPTFIIGVVYMSLVPSDNQTRLWLEEPIWSGMAMRIDWALFITTTPVMFFGADLFHRRALKEIWAIWGPKSRVPLFRRFYRFGSMNLLISAGTMVAYFSSLAVLILDATTKSSIQNRKRSSETFFDTVVFLTFFILIGRYLEAYSKAKTGDAVAMLSKLRPTEARLIEDGTVQTIPVNQLEVGDIVQIAHGQSPPTDGIVDQEGHFSFDESSLTGESRPVTKIRGDQVLTGSVNVADAVRVKVTALEGASMLGQIIDVVREGQARRAPIERFADVLTGYFVPVITLIAIVTWLIWLGLGLGGALPSAWLDVSRGGWPFWSLEFAIAVFVVACPCGLGLAAPTALFVGGGLAAKNAILVQGGGEAFQEASQLTTIVFDKTGTLTQGQMKVTELELISKSWNTSTIKAMAKLLEDASNHPIAKAVSEFCADSPANLECKDIQEVSGKGMVGTVTADGIQYQAAIGNERLLSFLNNTSEPEKGNSTVSEKNDFLRPRLQNHQSLGHSTAIFAVKHLRHNASPESERFVPVALFAISDPIRPEASTVLACLRAAGIDVHMCTGDNNITARAIAGQLSIPVTNVRAGVLPQEKATYINELQHPPHSQSPQLAKRRIVAFVGDGTNDTPALTAADVSIALSSGSDIAMTTASFILLNSNLNVILTLVSLSKRVFNRVKMNFAWAAVYNVCLVPVAAGIFFAVGANEHHGGWRLSPVWASCAMAASSVSVVMSSLALRLPELKVGMLKAYKPWGRR